MNSFDRCRETEVRGMQDILPFLRNKAVDGRFVMTDKGRLAEFLQETAGDCLLQSLRGGVVGIELKCEEEDRHGNLYLETFSNRDFDGEKWFCKPGWIYTNDADVLLYYFIAPKTLYCLSMGQLKQWAFERPGSYGGPGRIYDFPERPQKKHVQKNLAWGRCVPISVLSSEIRVRKYQLDGER